MTTHFQFRPDTVADLMTDTTLSYATGAGNIVVAANDYVQVARGGFTYKVARFGASDHDIATAGGVKLYAQIDGSGALHSHAFNARWDGKTDDSAAHQASFLAYAREGATTLIWPAGTSIQRGTGIGVPPTGIHIRGAGHRRTTIRKAPGLDEIHPILRESHTQGYFNRVDGFTIEGVHLEGNGDPDEKTEGAASLIRFYLWDDLTIRDCKFTRSRGYGLGLIGNEASPLDNGKKGNAGRAVIENNIFDSNGIRDFLLESTDPDDHIDVKDSEQLIIRGNTFRNAGDKDIDARSSFALIEGNRCEASNNVGISVQPNGSTTTSSVPRAKLVVSNNVVDSARGAGINISPFAAIGADTSEALVIIEGNIVRNCTTNISVSSPPNVQLVPYRLVITGNQSLDPAGLSDHIVIGSRAEQITMSNNLLKGGWSDGVVFARDQAGPLVFTGNSLDDIVGTGVTLSGDPAHRATVTGNHFANIRGYAVVGHSHGVFSGNAYHNVSAGGLLHLLGTGNRVDDATRLENLASAATVTLPENTRYIQVLGDATITRVVPTYSGDWRIFRTAGASTFADGGNLLLNGSFTGTSNDSIMLICDGTNWIQVGIEGVN